MLPSHRQTHASGPLQTHAADGCRNPRSTLAGGPADDRAAACRRAVKVVAASAAQSEGAAIAPLDACELLTKSDVEAVYGSVVGEPNRKALGGGPFWVSMCNYDNAHTDAPMLSVGLLAKAHGDAAGPEDGR